jgi:hypothetical protein
MAVGNSPASFRLAPGGGKSISLTLLLQTAASLFAANLTSQAIQQRDSCLLQTVKKTDRPHAGILSDLPFLNYDRRRHALLSHLSAWFLLDREVYMKCRALPQLAGNGDLPAHLLHDAVADGQA